MKRTVKKKLKKLKKLKKFLDDVAKYAKKNPNTAIKKSLNKIK
jgi:hypothetical protein